MPILDAIKDLVSILETSNYTDLPESVNQGLVKYLDEDEKTILTLRNFRAIYRAPRWLDSNTFFNSWFILTEHRIVVARNSSEFKRFRDIPLNTITQLFCELDRTEPKITINSPGHEDIIEFPKRASSHCEGLEESLKSAIDNARKIMREPGDDGFMYCGKCGSKILRSSHFCSECGVRIQTTD